VRRIIPVLDHIVLPHMMYFVLCCGSLLEVRICQDLCYGLLGYDSV
jgi:hypothetical protein